MALTLCYLGIVLGEMEQPAEAVAALEEAREPLEPLAEQYSEAYQPHLREVCDLLWFLNEA